MDDKKIKEEAGFITKVFEYIIDHKLDMNNEDDVIKALKALDAKRTDNEYVQALIPVLEIIGRMIEKEFNYRKAQETVEESMKILK